ncbi:protein disulfide-isomerase [Malassezia caprae]|uniref:protein disulfide-isomerase n=1 Tax=Malassezia caprae TaxID=1381934 RepID=A0AAF0EA97_9BASI|nr:protein disulfide-isomerase [Malassezia caprae]
MRVAWLFSIVLVLLVAIVRASNVLDLTETKDYDSVVGKSTGVLVEFFAPWCGHCKRLAPEYEKLADAFAGKKDKVIIAKVDGDKNRDLANRIGLQGFPTIKYFPPHSETGIDYENERTAEALAAFLTQKTSVQGHIEPPTEPQVVELTAETFDEVVMDPKLNVLVEFYAPWCGFCKRLAPIYEHVAQVFERDPECVVARIDVNDPENESIKTRFQVSSYPTLNFFPAGSDDKWPRPYLKERTLEDFVAFMNEKCGTFRNLDGTLTALAGRLPALDGLASRFYSAGESARALLLDETKKYVENMQANVLAPAKLTAAQYYTRVMERVSRDGTDYVQRESKRLSKLLRKHADGVSTLAAEKVDEITRKSNVLAAFVNEKIGQAAERASSSAFASQTASAESAAHDEL